MSALKHYGTPRHSGRYPWGSGEDPYQHDQSFLGQYYKLHDAGQSDTDIAKAFGMSLKELRAKRSSAVQQQADANHNKALKLKGRGWSNTAIAKELGVSEGTIRNILKAKEETRRNISEETAKVLQKELAEKAVVDIGPGVEHGAKLGITRTKLDTAVQMLKEKGYKVVNVQVDQVTNAGRKTTIQCLCRPDVDPAAVFKDKTLIKSIDVYSPDGGDTFQPSIAYPAPLDSKRVFVRYAEDGGADRDGTIELRRGVQDLSLGALNFSQVRICVDGTHYMKGMALYRDDIPDGYDVVYNSRKHVGTPLFGKGDQTVFKPLKDSVDMPFGAKIKEGGQYYYEDKDGNKKLSPINLVTEEGDWAEWSRNLPSQFLGKQDQSLIKRQLNLELAARKDEFAEIMSTNNLTVRAKRLEEFASSCDTASVDLKAASLPGQQTHAILPVPSMKDGQVYAPNYENGTKVALVRFPHAGLFEIAECTVNNNNKEAKMAIGSTAVDAIGININTASKLSGADFDGDTVLVLPQSDKVHIKSRESLPGLVGFDPQEAYPYVEGQKVMTHAEHGKQMGIVSNLITDMTLQGASDDEVERAVKHSMVVVDAEKHKLNYQQSYADQRIAELKAKYQHGGASTLLSAAKSPVYVDQRSLYTKIDPETGKLEYKPTGAKNWKGELKQDKVPLLSTVDDAYELSSGTLKESLYADFSNKMKALANEARKAQLAAEKDAPSRDPKAAKEYAEEVEVLSAKLKKAKQNSPRERQAQIYANAAYISFLQEAKYNGVEIDKEHRKKFKQQAIEKYRRMFGASKKDVTVVIEPKEWEAIQAGAITKTMLSDILDNTDMDIVSNYATPRKTTALSSARISHIKSMASSGFTNQQIADQLGISVSTVQKYVK